MKKYSAYLFDLYDVLVDIRTDENSPAFWNKMSEYFASRKANFTPEELHSKYEGYILDETAALAESFKITTPNEERFPEIELDKVFYWLYSDKFDDNAPINNSIPNATESSASSLDWQQEFVDAVTVTPELLRSTMQYFRKESTVSLKLKPGVLKILHELRETGAKLILLCNAQRSFAEAELKELGLWTEFDDIFISSDYCCRKPDRYFYNAPLNKHLLKPSDCLVIEAAGADNINGAKALGMDIVSDLYQII